MTVAGQTVTFTQAANSCSYSVTPTSVSVRVNRATQRLSVTSGTSCSWTAASSVAWITITSGAAVPESVVSTTPSRQTPASRERAL